MNIEFVKKIFMIHSQLLILIKSGDTFQVIQEQATLTTGCSMQVWPHQVVFKGELFNIPEKSSPQEFMLESYNPVKKHYQTIPIQCEEEYKIIEVIKAVPNGILLLGSSQFKEHCILLIELEKKQLSVWQSLNVEIKQDFANLQMVIQQDKPIFSLSFKNTYLFKNQNELIFVDLSNRNAEPVKYQISQDQLVELYDIKANKSGTILYQKKMLFEENSFQYVKSQFLVSL